MATVYKILTPGWNSAIESRGDSPLSDARVFLALAIKLIEEKLVGGYGEDWRPIKTRPLTEEEKKNAIEKHDIEPYDLEHLPSNLVLCFVLCVSRYRSSRLILPCETNQIKVSDMIRKLFRFKPGVKQTDTWPVWNGSFDEPLSEEQISEGHKDD